MGLTAKQVNLTKISKSEIEKMLYQIAVYANNAEAKRFNRLSNKKQQIVTYLLQKRMKRRKDAETLMDSWTIKEVIDDAQNDNFIDFGIIRKKV